MNVTNLKKEVRKAKALLIFFLLLLPLIVPVGWFLVLLFLRGTLLLKILILGSVSIVIGVIIKVYNSMKDT